MGGSGDGSILNGWLGYPFCLWDHCPPALPLRSPPIQWEENEPDNISAQPRFLVPITKSQTRTERSPHAKHGAKLLHVASH